MALMNDPTQIPFFKTVVCSDCWDSTLVNTPYGLGKCVTCLERTDRVITPAAKRLAEVAWRRVEKKQSVDPQVLSAARMVIHYSASAPLSGYTIQGQLRATERDVKRFMRELRREWLLPIGSSRQPPFGYFWIISASEYLEWERVFRAQAIDELVTLFRLRRANFPELAGQGAFDFVESIHDQMREAI